jgi:TPP-dependent trihydroxycyclohexane-1,2-dione (THcHDO) dehydratase
MRLTVAQALVRFLTVQYSQRDEVPRRFFAGCFGIFGHGNIAGIGQALLEAGSELQYYQARNEQAMVHAAAGYARASHRLRAFACTSSIGPGATNMVTGAALATVNRLPVLLLPGDVFATRPASPVLQELEDPRSADVSVNDCFRPVSAYFDRIWRPEQLPAALLNTMRVLTDPAATGAVTLALPQDTAVQAFDWPESVAGAAAAARARAGGRGGVGDQGQQAAAAGGRRWRPLQRGDPGAGQFRLADRHPGGRDAGWQGVDRVRAPERGRRHRRYRDHGRQRAGPRGGPGDRGGHPVE